MTEAAEKGPALARVMAEIQRLGLQQHLLELETQGFTVLKSVLSEHQLERGRAAILARYQQNTGCQIDISNEDGSGMPTTSGCTFCWA